MTFKTALMLSAASLALAHGSSFAQETNDDPKKDDVEHVVVTGVATGRNRQDTSISVSSINADKISQTAPRGTAEVLRALPGIRSESSAGGGNSNIAVRGMPISTGGAKYLGLQEDGLPILLFGDFDFAPADGFYKVDTTLARVEAVRGGSASVLATNSPGGIINFISRNGNPDFAEGSVILSAGLDHSDYRGDFQFGGPLDDKTYFHIGGHYQQGGDYRDFGFDAISGGQVRASLTREFENGFIRVFAKWLDKADATYMPQAAGLSGDEVVDTVGGFSANNDSLHSPFIRFGRDVDGENTVNNYDLADGIRTQIKSVGMRASFDLGAGFTIDNNGRFADITGKFQAPFTHQVFNADTLLASFGAGTTARYFNGPRAGQPVTSASLLGANGNSLISEVAYFDTDLDDMSNFTNEVKLSKSFEVGGSTLDITAGYFFMHQNFVQDWHWNQFLTDTTNDAALIDLFSGVGAPLTEHGILGYNHAFNWDGNNRNYDLEFQSRAPFLAGTWAIGNLTVDGGVRFDTLEQRGTRTEAAGGPFDVDGDGVIDPPEVDVSLNTGVGGIANFEVDHTSYSVGANYRLTPGFALFGRVSSGVAFNGERQHFNSLDAGGGLVPGGDETYIDQTDQYEVGFKWRDSSDSVPGDLNLYVTLFHAETQEDNFEITTGTTIGNEYESQGVETEFQWRAGGFDLGGSVTYTDAEITSSDTTPANAGNVPRRQADWIWTVTPSYGVDGLGRIGVNFTGTTDTFVDDDNRLIMPGTTVTNAFLDWDITDRARLSFTVNNVFDEVLFTEAENGRVFDTNGDGRNDVIVARSINGRSATVAFGFRFGDEPAPAPVMAAPPPPPPPPVAVPKQFVIFFGSNKCNITAEADAVLAEAATAAKSTGAVSVRVVGHADSVGSASANQKLSECRANAAKAGLVAKGVADGAISTSGKGESELLVQTGDDVKEPQNRRATIDM